MELSEPFSFASAELDAARRGLLTSLLVSAWMVEARDPYTGGHLWRVAKMSERLAIQAGFGPSEAARIAIAGFLHDLGKIGIDDAVLRKSGRLTEEEYEHIRSHPERGAAMITGHPLASLVIGVIHHHHERPDGRGYPHGLEGDDLPQDAMLVGICDAFDAMTSTRPYRKGMPMEAAIAQIEQGFGTQFDRRLAVLFVDMAKRGEFSDIVGYSDEGIPLRVCASCGPTLIQKRSNHAGHYLACPACGGRSLLKLVNAGGLDVVPTEQRLPPAQRFSTPDMEQLEGLADEWSHALHPDQ